MPFHFSSQRGERVNPGDVEVQPLFCQVETVGDGSCCVGNSLIIASSHGKYVDVLRDVSFEVGQSERRASYDADFPGVTVGSKFLDEFLERLKQVGAGEGELHS